jgi:preprotein translocase subunit SecB
MKNIESVLTLESVVFDKIEFNRKGFKNDHEIVYQIEVQIGKRTDNINKVTLILKGNKESEYDFIISLSGYFSFSSNGNEKIDNNQEEALINKNAVAILMPYLRSEVSLLTAQPYTECVVLPPFNINKMLE